MIDLFEHQKTGIEFLKNSKKAILADSMGLGKTYQAIISARETGHNILVVCPASLKINWKREISKIYPQDMVMVISTTDFHDPLGVRWFIINYDIMAKMMPFIDIIINSHGVDTLILDEAHYIKGKSIRAASIIGGRAKKGDDWIKNNGISSQMKNVYCLTGTPLLNRPIELFNILKAIDHPLGRVRTAFAKRYCGATLKTIYKRNGTVIRYVDESGATNLNELREKLKGYMLRRKKEEVLDLPERIISIQECEMDSEWRKKYDTAWDDYIKFIRENPIPERNIDNIVMTRQLVEVQKLKQVCSQSKIKRISQDIENAIEQDEKIIVFSQYTATIQGIANELFSKGIGYQTLTGQDDLQSRQSAVDRFQSDPDTKVFISNIKAGGVGITLTAASIVMFADMDWSPEIHNQAIDRAHRIGQKMTVNAYFYICPDTIEEDIIDILNSKKNILNTVIEGSQDSIKTMNVAAEFLKRMSTSYPLKGS